MQQGGVLEARASTEAVPDRELLRAVRAGDIDVFDVLWNRYHGQLLGYAVKRLPIQQAEDAISIVMEGTLRALIAGKGPEQFSVPTSFNPCGGRLGASAPMPS